MSKTETPPNPEDLRVGALAIAKNEGPWLIEWLAHCKAVGFNEVALGTNDCDDGTDEIAEELQSMGLLTHFDNRPPYYRRNYLQVPSLQLTAYDRMQSMPQVQACDWVMPLDIDEFLVCHVGNGSVQELCAKHHKAHGIMIRWRMFGDSGLSGMLTPPITDQLTKCAEKTDINNDNVKMLVRDHQDVELEMHVSVRRKIDPSAGIWKRAMRNARGMQERAYINFDGQLYAFQRAHGAKKFLEFFKDKARDYVDAQVNHYAIRTVEICRLKAIRGDAYYAGTNRFQQDYFDRFNRNHVEDASIFKYREKRDALMAEWLRNERLRALHDEAMRIMEGKLQKLAEAGYDLPETTEKNIKLSWSEKRKMKRENRPD